MSYRGRLGALILGLTLCASGASCAARKESRPEPIASTSSAPKPVLPERPPSIPPSTSCPILVHPETSTSAESRIQAAIDQAAGGDCAEVVLSAGVYAIKQPLQLRTGVRLAGQRYRRTYSVIRPTRDFAGRALLTTDYDFNSRERKQSNVSVEKLHLLASPPCKKKENCAPAKVGLWLDKTAYPIVRDCTFSSFPDGGAGIRGGGILYLKVQDSSFLGIYGWGIDLSVEHAPRRPETGRPATYYAVSVGSIEGSYFSSRRGVRVEPGFNVGVRNNQFEGGLSMIHAFERQSSAMAVEGNYFEVAKTPQDIPGHGTIALRGTGRVVGNLINGPPKGSEPSFVGPGIEIVASESMTIADNTIRCFDPAIRVRNMLPGALTQFGNLIAPKRRVKQPWDAPVLEGKTPPTPSPPDADDDENLYRVPPFSPLEEP